MHHSFISNPVWDEIILIAARLQWVPMHACTLLFYQKKPAGCCGKSFPVSVRRARQATQPGKVFPNEWRHRTWYRLSKQDKHGQAQIRVELKLFLCHCLTTAAGAVQHLRTESEYSPWLQPPAFPNMNKNAMPCHAQMSGKESHQRFSLLEIN